MESKPKRRGRPPGAHPPAVFTADVHIYMTPEQKEWVLNRGGAGYIRRLVEEDRKRRKACDNATTADAGTEPDS